MKFLAFSNVFNFRNREDYRYALNKIKEFFNTRSEEEWIQHAKSNLVYDGGGVYRRSENSFYSTPFRHDPFYRRDRRENGDQAENWGVIINNHLYP